MSAARRRKASDPGTVCRELVERAAAGRLPRLLVLAPPTRGEDEPWFGERVLRAAREAARAEPDFDLLDLDGGGDEPSIDALEAFLQTASLFSSGRRALILARAGRLLSRRPRLVPALVQAAADPGGPDWMAIQLGGRGSEAVVGALAAAGDSAEVVRFRRLYGDPPPWRPHDPDASEAAGFAAAEARARGLTLQPGAAGALVEVAGSRPADLIQALDHFALLGDQAIAEEEVRRVVAHSAEGNAFAFASAVLAGDGRAALQLLTRIRDRGLQSWSGKRLGPQEAFSLLISILAGERRRTAAVRAALDRGADLPAALKEAGLAAGGPIARRMEERLRSCDRDRLDRVLGGIRRAERRLKVEGLPVSLHTLEELVLHAHQGGRRR
ncbi:MAG: hypothetical protein D6702_04000 [Planctomycetota bacterium]|nr:MAG: hypothetical protein D6702_04000 [Planctomycetota bacterium]